VWTVSILQTTTPVAASSATPSTPKIPSSALVRLHPFSIFSVPLTYMPDIDECASSLLNSCEDKCGDGLHPPGDYTCDCTAPRIKLQASDRTCFNPIAPTCGNGAIDNGEECELGNLGCDDSCRCTSLFMPTSPPSLSCNQRPPVLRCNDGRRDIVSGIAEECDSGLGCNPTNCTCLPGFTSLSSGIDCNLDVVKGSRPNLELPFVIFDF